MLIVWKPVTPGTTISMDEVVSVAPDVGKAAIAAGRATAVNIVTDYPGVPSNYYARVNNANSATVYVQGTGSAPSDPSEFKNLGG